MDIAPDNCSSVQIGTGTSLTYSKTNTGSNLFLVVSVGNYAPTTDIITGVTYNGVAMTKAVTRFGAGGGIRTTIFTLAAPATGANNVVITASESCNLRSFASSYTGAQSSSTPDATGSADVSTVGAGDCNLSITTVAANCWLVATNSDSLLDPDAAATGSVLRGSLTDTTIFDSGPKATPGANNVGLHFAGSNTMQSVGVSIAPGVTVNANMLLLFF
jgi:hypothetical protein